MIGKPAFENLSLGPIRSVLSTFWMDVEDRCSPVGFQKCISLVIGIQVKM